MARNPAAAAALATVAANPALLSRKSRPMTIAPSPPVAAATDRRKTVV
nr:hypothetical protein [Methylobacterium sp. J-090]